MESVIENQRRLHEEMDRIMYILSTQLQNEPKGGKDLINMEHRIKMLLDRYMECANQLKEGYEDKDGSLKREFQEISGPNEFVEFNIRLKSLKEFYKRAPGGNEIAIPLSTQLAPLAKLAEGDPEALANAPDMAEFTDEEGYGKFLDMHALFNEYYNFYVRELQPERKAKPARGAAASRQPELDYLSYLETFDRLFEIPKHKKFLPAYKSYLEHLVEYLHSFISRVHPLIDLREETELIRKQLDLQWDNGTFPGWPKEKTSINIDLNAVNSWQELSLYGLDRLKQALLALGLKCGGTLEERAKRLFRARGKRPDEFDPADRVGGKPVRLSAATAAPSASLSEPPIDWDRAKALAFMEAQVYELAEEVSEQRAAAVENVQRKQASTLDERERDEEGDAAAAEAEAAEEKAAANEGDDEVPYNPKDVPLGWDGKPIPYWLYKLHGLNLYFTCEICGNSTYRGPLAFQRHFTEWRHAHGMRCLGIPNTAHFHNITKIDEALSLWDRLKNTKEREMFDRGEEEEYEDTKGNVLNKKTFEDLKRQGVL